MRPWQKRGGSEWGPQTTRVYRRRVSSATAATGTGHRAVSSATAAAGTGHRAEAGTATTGNDNPATGAVCSPSPQHGAEGSTAHPSPLVPHHQQQGSSAAATGHQPHGSRSWVPKQDSAHLTTAEPVPSQERPTPLTAAATPRGHAPATGHRATPSPTASSGSGPRATPSPASSSSGSGTRATSSTAASSGSGPRASPPPTSSAPCAGFPLSSWPTPSRDAKTPSSSHRSGSSSSSSGSHPTSWGGSGSTAPSGTRKSFASLARSPREQALQQEFDSTLQLQLLTFLNEFTRESGQVPFYKTQAAALKEEGSFKFQINFDHLMDCNRDMAFAICNSRNRMGELICPVICQFLFDENLSDDTRKIYDNLDVVITSMPRSIKSITEFIHEKGGWVRSEFLAERYNECVASDAGIMVVQRALADMFRGHAEDQSWDGSIDISDIVVINDEEVRITKKPMPGGPASRAKDVRRIGSIFMPKFILGGRMALYFCVLRNDLANASENDVQQEWFKEYILSHPALKSSCARYHLVTAMHQTCKKFGVCGSPLSDFMEASPSWTVNWRFLIPSDVTSVFYKVYYHNFTNTEASPEPFPMTNGGLLAYKRHFNQHADVHLKKIQDLSEVEKIGARRFEEALPHIIKTLLKDCSMHNSGPLCVYWKAYRGDGSLTGKVGVYISFW